MIRIFTADYILPVSSDPIQNGVVAVNEEGEIVEIYEENSPQLAGIAVEKLEGIIVPGFVNTHCHLELSHLLNKIPKYQGLVPFIKKVIDSRNTDPDMILEAMEKADKLMWENGIVAVGDISNTSISKHIKQKSKLYYHTFIEVLGFDPQKAEDVFDAGIALQETFAPLNVSIAPHAPYSVSRELFRAISSLCNEQKGNLLTIHNQESEEENKLYQDKTGAFLDFYKDLNICIDFFEPQGRNSLQSILPLLPEKQQILLVHNTYTTLADIHFVQHLSKEIAWCFCPKANLYIENRLPELELFLSANFDITIGTDSLASNDSLCILSELKALHTALPALELSKTIAWSTLNGAKFLKIDHLFGSIEKGKKPGLNLITEVNNLKITSNSQVKKLV